MKAEPKSQAELCKKAWGELVELAKSGASDFEIQGKREALIALIAVSDARRPNKP